MFNEEKIILNNGVLLADPIQTEIYLKAIGEPVTIKYNTHFRTLRYPMIAQYYIDNNKKYVKFFNFNDFIKKYILFYQIIDKNFVQKLIDRKNKKVKEHKLLKKTKKDNYSDILESKLGKNKYEIGCYHITIDFLLDKYNCYLNSVLGAKIRKILI